MILMWANPLLGPLEGECPENGNLLCFFRQFRVQKRFDFYGQNLPMTLEMDLPTPKSLLPVPSKQKVH
jgi:hypothetical protein